MKKLLIVDDSDAIRQQLRGDLVAAGYAVVEAQDGAIGLSVLKSNPDVDLIICDVNMPNMDGLTMCGKIKQDTSYKQAPIFMLTTEASPEMKARGKEAGVRAWIVKPYEKGALLGALEKMLGK